MAGTERGIDLTVVDAFTSRPFSGNPAAVCILEAHANETWMQQVAAEMNLSETAFLVKRSDGWDLRWFTPKAEVELCGHATLASAHVLWERGLLMAGEAARFHTLSGALGAVRRDGAIWLDFPVWRNETIETTPLITRALNGAKPTALFQNKHDVTAVLESELAVRQLAPDLGAVAEMGLRGMVVTARASTPGYDYVDRYFAPAYGVPEDPATGSIQCALGPYWSQELGKSDLVCYQASARGAELRVHIPGNPVVPGDRTRSAERVHIGGQAVTVSTVHLLHGPAKSAP